MILKIQKSWQTADPILVLHVTTRVEGFPKKAYLLCDARQAQFGMRLTTEKPAAITPQAAFINLFRKYCRTAVISDIVENAANGDLWLRLHDAPREEPDWYLCLAKSRPPELSLVSKGRDDVVRTGGKGTFTKRKTFADAWPVAGQAGFRSIFDSLVAEFVAANAAVPAIETEDHAGEIDSASAESAVDVDEGLPAPQRELVTKLRRKMKTLRKSLEKTQSQIPAPEELASADQRARLLQQFAYLIKPDSLALQLTADHTGGLPIAIPLDPERAPGANIEAAFVRVKKLIRARDSGQAYAAQVDRELRAADADLVRLKAEPLSAADLEAIRFHFKIPVTRESAKSDHSHGAPVTVPYRTYMAASGHRLLVGRNAEDNDALTKSARSSDWWLHTVGVAGSHVVIPVDASLRNGLPEPLRRAAALLALHHSALKNDLRGEVYITRVMNLRKQKGMPAGLWQVLRSETLFVTYTKEEADELLGQLKV